MGHQPLKKILPAKALALLGKTHDNKIASRFNLTYTLVRQERLRRKIPSVRKRVVWTKARLKLLGSVSDVVLGLRFRIGHSTIYYKRKALGIPARYPNTQQKKRHWSSRQLARLGVDSDTAIAKSMGLTVAATGQKRKVLGIPAPPSTRNKAREWQKREKTLLGTGPDRLIALKLGVTRNEVQNMRRGLGIPSYVETLDKALWTPQCVALLGQLRDSEVARRMGISQVVVSNQRIRRKILPCSDSRIPPRLFHLLGTMSDVKLARRLGVTRQDILNRRQLLGIPPFRVHRRTGDSKGKIQK